MRPRSTSLVIVAISAALVAAPGLAHEQNLSSVDKAAATSAIYPPPGGEIAPPQPATTQSSTSPQPNETWSGTTTPGQGLTGSYDIHEFTVLSGYANDMMTVSINWHSTGHVAYDYDLYLDFFNPLTNRWEQILTSGAANYQGLDPASESVRYARPDPGQYRARVSNYLSTQLNYSGEVAFSTLSVPAPVGNRAFGDRPDTNSLAKVHVIYFVPSDRPDESLDTNATLSNSIASMNNWFDTQTGNRHVRMDTFVDPNGITKLDISFVRGNLPRSRYTFNSMTAELEAKGFSSPPSRKRYMVFAALSTSYCGIAAYPIADDTAYAQWAATMLDSPSGCKARAFGNPTIGGSYSEVITAQELMHNEGVVPLTAPRTCGPNYGHVCTAGVMAQAGNLDPESRDIMFPYVGRPLSQKSVDLNHDDYYQHSFPYRDFTDSIFLEAS